MQEQNFAIKKAINETSMWRIWFIRCLIDVSPDIAIIDKRASFFIDYARVGKLAKRILLLSSCARYQDIGFSEILNNFPEVDPYIYSAHKT